MLLSDAVLLFRESRSADQAQPRAERYQQVTRPGTTAQVSALRRRRALKQLAAAAAGLASCKTLATNLSLKAERRETINTDS